MTDRYGLVSAHRSPPHHPSPDAMSIVTTTIPDTLVIEPKVFSDDRG